MSSIQTLNQPETLAQDQRVVRDRSCRPRTARARRASRRPSRSPRLRRGRTAGRPVAAGTTSTSVVSTTATGSSSNRASAQRSPTELAAARRCRGRGPLASPAVAILSPRRTASTSLRRNSVARIAELEWRQRTNRRCMRGGSEIRLPARGSRSSGYTSTIPASRSKRVTGGVAGSGSRLRPACPTTPGGERSSSPMWKASATTPQGRNTRAISQERLQQLSSSKWMIE